MLSVLSLGRSDEEALNVKVVFFFIRSHTCSMIDSVLVSADLWIYVLDSWVKRGAKLSTD